MISTCHLGWVTLGLSDCDMHGVMWCRLGLNDCDMHVSLVVCHIGIT